MFYFHQILMVFFLIGYLIVLFAIVTRTEFLSHLFVGSIFFFGAVFILLGILLQARMLASVRYNYLQAVEVSEKLEKERQELINDILDYSKIEAGKLALETLDFDLRAVVEDLSDVLAIRAHGKGLEFSFLVPPRIPVHLRGDPGRLRQILLNLGGNAIKFTDEGEVVIRVNLERETDSHAAFRFEVSDTGIGIPQEQLKHIFESFSKVDTSSTRKYEGTGLGLTISKQLVELMNGDIGVESERGRGSTFWFTVLFEKQKEIKELEVFVPEDIRGKHILVVDDNETNRYILTEQLKSWDCRVEEAENGRIALEKLMRAKERGDPFEISIVDVQMPEMDGFEATRVIRDPGSKVLNHGVPIIAMTAHAMKGDRERCLEAGMDDYVSKPVKPQELLEAIERQVFQNIRGDEGVSELKDPPDREVFDRSGLIERIGGDEAFCEELLEVFLQDFETQFTHLGEALEQDDKKSLERVAHTIKGSAANISRPAGTLICNSVKQHEPQ